MEIPNKRQFILFSAMAAPLVVLIIISLLAPASKESPKIAPAPVRAAAKPAVPTPSLTEMRKQADLRVKEAAAMTLTDYAVKQRDDQLLPPNLEVYRMHVRENLSHLNSMSETQWEAESRQRADQIRQRAVAPKP